MTHHSEPHPVSDISDIRIRQGVRVAPRGRSERDLFLVLFLLSAALTVAPTLRAWGRTPCPVSQSPQQRRVAGNDAKDEKEVSELEPGKRIKRELAGGEQHVYQIRLNADQFLKVIVEQKGIDVVVDVLGPDGKQLQEFDTEARLQATEEVTVAAETSGEYRLIVRPVYKEATAGDYEIRIEEVRPATGDDRAMQEANKLFDEFLKLQPTGNYREEIPLLERTLEIREKILGPDHRLVLETLNALASAYFEKGDYAKAESLYRRTLAISKKLGEQNGDPATLTGLSGVYYGRGEYAESKLLLQQALAILEQALGLEHPRVAQTLFNLGIIAHERGEYAEAESLSRRALAIREKTLGPDHPDVAASLNFLAILYRNMGEYENAALFYQRSLAISEKVLGPESAPVATTLINIANLYCDRGEYAKAEPLYQRALAIIEKALGPQHRYFATTLANLAALNEMRGEYAKAEPLYQQALASFEKALGPDHPDLAGAINGLADIYRTRREYDKAEPLYERARSIREKALGPEDLKLARSLDGLADIYRARREYDKAQTLYERALSIREKALGPQHNFVAVSFGGLAKLYAAKGDLARSLDFQARANAVSERNMALNLATGSEQQKLAYLALSSIQTDFTLSLHSRYAPADPQALDLAFTTLLRRKGRGLDAMTDTIASLRRRAGAEDQKLFDQLAEARSQYAALSLREPSTSKPDTYLKLLKPLEERIENLEADLSARSGEYRAQSQPATLAAVQAALPEGGALVEFTLFMPRDLQTDQCEHPRYLAYVLPAQGAPKWADLGEAESIDRSIAEWRKALQGRPDVNELGRELDEKLMRPIRSLLSGTHHLLIAPDGLLNLIPFAALVDEHKRYLIETYTISYLTSGRDLLRLQRAGVSHNPPLVMANPVFGRAANAGNGERGKIDARALSFRPLPGTQNEALAIKALMPEATVRLRGEATEAALKQVRSPRFLHIATHGFFLSDEGTLPTEAPGMLGDDQLRISALRLGKWAAHIKDPLLRSGLALSGANGNRSGGEDGVLTALEAAGLDLWGTKLVVLSACDTGVGEVRNGEGVQGLRRALVLAGSESQVMSLWPISDSAARVMMIRYYIALRRGEGRSEALRQVQLKMLMIGKRKHPFYWAAFIESGAWTSMKDGGQSILQAGRTGNGR